MTFRASKFRHAVPQSSVFLCASVVNRSSAVHLRSPAIGYILNREGLVSPPTLALLLGWPLIVGVTRLYHDRHWASDILAGWVAGTAVAATSALLYDVLQQRSSSTP